MASEDPPKKISLALGGAKKASRPPAANGLKRPRASLQDDEEDDGTDDRAQTVSHFDQKAGGAIDENQPKSDRGPLVISAQKNRNWKDASKRRRQQSELPSSRGDAAGRGISIEQAEKREHERVFGLNIMKRAGKEDGGLADERMDGVEEDGAAKLTESKAENGTATREKTADERAMDALLGKVPESSLVVPAVTETEAFQDDFKSAPEMASLDDYARVPVEEFGAAMLRGMGWKDGQGVGASKGSKAQKTEIPQRRPALLGIGAKSDAAVEPEMGGWGRAARGKEIKIYNPVLLKDKRTGELLTEEELKRRQDDAQRRAYEEEFEQRERETRKRRDEDEDDDSRRHHRRRDERHRGDDRDRRHRRDHRDGRDDKDKRHMRDEHRDGDGEDEEYRRRKREKERQRRERDYDGHSRDEDRTKRHDRDRDRDRYRDHARPSDKHEERQRDRR